MKNRAHTSTGVRRLSLVAGAVGVIYAIHDIQLIELFSARPIWWGGLAFLFLGCAFWFAIGWLAIRVPAWVIAGFIGDRAKRSTQL